MLLLEEKYQLHNMTAFDLVFKIYFVFNIKYPELLKKFFVLLEDIA